MKQLIVIIIFMSIAFSQVKWSAGFGVELADSEDYEVRQWVYDGLAAITAVGSIGNAGFLTQVRADYKQFNLTFDTKIHAFYNDGWFTPTTAMFDSELSYSFEKYTIGIAHSCVHPLLTVDKRYDLMYGGYNYKLKLHYNIH